MSKNPALITCILKPAIITYILLFTISIIIVFFTIYGTNNYNKTKKEDNLKISDFSYYIPKQNFEDFLTYNSEGITEVVPKFRHDEFIIGYYIFYSREKE